MSASPTSGFVRFLAVRDPSGSRPSILTPVLLGNERPVVFTPGFVYDHVDEVDQSSKLLNPATKAVNKAESLFNVLGIEHGQVGHNALAPRVDRGVLANLGIDKHKSEFVRTVFAGVVLDDCRDDWSIGGEPRRALHTKDPAKGDTVRFVSGICLGGSESSIAQTPSGTYRLVEKASSADLTEQLLSVRFEPEDELSFYERENAYRLAITIAKLVRRLPGRKIRVRLDVPRTQYYLYIHDAYQNGLITPEVSLAWFDQVDARRELVLEHFQNVLRLLGIDTDLVSTTDELRDVATYLRQEYKANRKPTLDDLVRIMRDTGDHLWRHVLDPQVRERAKLKPLDVKGFNGAAYSVTCLREAEKGPTIQVDDPVERPILESAEQLATQRSWKDPHCGVFPHSRFFALTDGVTEHPYALYWNDPGHRAVVNDPAGVSGLPHGEEIVLDDLLPELYRIA